MFCELAYQEAHVQNNNYNFLWTPYRVLILDIDEDLNWTGFTTFCFTKDWIAVIICPDSDISSMSSTNQVPEKCTSLLDLS